MELTRLPDGLTGTWRELGKVDETGLECVETGNGGGGEGGGHG